MNELRFLEVIGLLDDDIVREAYPDGLHDTLHKPAVSRKKIYAVSTVAAAAVITIGTAAFYHTHKPSDMLDAPSQSEDKLPDPDNTVINATEPPASTDTSAAPPETQTFTPTAVIASAAPPDSNVPSEPESASAPAPVPDSKHGTVSRGYAHTQSAANSRPARITSPASSHTVTTTPAEQKTAPAAETPTQMHKVGIDIEGCYYLPFSETLDPWSDSFASEEIHHIDIRTSDGFYRQLDTDEYSRHGINNEVTLSDFGGYIGKVVEVDDTGCHHGSAAESQEPALADADVYRYAPSGDNKAFIIVKKDRQCSIFIADIVNTSSGFRKGLAFFNVQSADDIQYIEYSVNTAVNGLMTTVRQNTITDTDRISAFYDLLCQLQPEDHSDLPEHIGTPQWLVDAWENYRNNPSPPPIENYRITIKLKDGTALQDINYQPFLGNGYVECMEQLTPEQNSALKELLR